MLLHSNFLCFQPSQIGASSLLLAIRINFHSLKVDSGKEGDDVILPFNDERSTPLQMWTPEVERLTGLTCAGQVEPAYKLLFSRVLKPRTVV